MWVVPEDGFSGHGLGRCVLGNGRRWEVARGVGEAEPVTERPQLRR